MSFAGCYRNCRVLLTGHTGFKGSWLALWLQSLEAQVTGLSLAPDTNPNHWDLLNLKMPGHHIDIRNADALARVIGEAKPEIIFHLAAQSLVRRSYGYPAETWHTNVMGTVNLLEACRNIPGVKAVVVVTTDKCYENRESPQGYNENDRLGGHDPYSASKAAVELVVSSYRDSFFKNEQGPLLATARAGNVIGGGDWAEDRLVPDLARAQESGKPLIVRAPASVRPWQHVLEPLAGYLQLGQGLLRGEQNYQGAWNFGPDDGGMLSVSDLLDKFKESWPAISWQEKPDSSFHETATLRLDSTKARQELNWKPVWPLDRQIRMTAQWYKTFLEGGGVLSPEQLDYYQKAARESGAAWA